MHELIGDCIEDFDLCIDNKSAIEISRNQVMQDDGCETLVPDQWDSG